MVIGIIHNGPEGLKEGNSRNLLYTFDGILCGGSDGRLRLLKSQDSKGSGQEEVSSIGLVASHNVTSNFLNVVYSYTQSNFMLVDEEVFHALKNDHSEILSLAASGNFRYFGVLRSSGLVQILQLDVESPKISGYNFRNCDFVRSNVSAFTGLCSITIGNKAYYVVGYGSNQITIVTESISKIV